MFFLSPRALLLFVKDLYVKLETQRGKSCGSAHPLTALPTHTSLAVRLDTPPASHQLCCDWSLWAALCELKVQGPRPAIWGGTPDPPCQWDPSVHFLMTGCLVVIALQWCVHRLYIYIDWRFSFNNISLWDCIYSSNTMAIFHNFCFKRIVSEPVYEQHRKVSLSLISCSSLIYCILNELETSDGQFSSREQGFATTEGI